MSESEIPKRPEPGSIHNQREFNRQCQANEHAVAKALWEALIRSGCTPQTNNTYNTPTGPVSCLTCQAMGRVKASGWTP